MIIFGAFLIAGVIISLLSVSGAISAQRIDKDALQVIYMANGQAYFGKLQNTNGTYLVVKTPYTAQSVKAENGQNASNDGTTSLLKVSAQVYGSDDSIAIKSDQVLFWQNLRSDSKVSQAIKNKSKE